ncbi:MAG: hypothetical protein QXT45_05950 [Candidatus Bilamarchaeaceae archaeon]
MPDIFGRAPLLFGGAIAADTAVMLFSGIGPGSGAFSQTGVMAQNFNVDYTQQVQRIYELGAPVTYYIVGRTQGNGNIGRILGPRLLTKAFYLVFGDACFSAFNNMYVGAGVGCYSQSRDLTTVGDFAEFYLLNCLLINYSLSVNANDMVFGERLPFVFVSLYFPD